MIHYREAQEIIRGHARSFGRERVSLEQAGGRVLAETVLADRDYPPFNRSAMDGYAIRYRDWENGVRDFAIAETVYAGGVASGPIGAGECYKIMTGAAVPESADTVFRKEDIREELSRIHTGEAACRLYQHISRQGEDLRKGEAALAGNVLCDAPVMGLLASLGRRELTVEKWPVLSLLTTGDEVVPVDRDPSPVQIRNSNYWVLQTLCKPWTDRPLSFAHCRDDKKALLDAVGKASGADVLIMSGGVSAGDADFVPAVLEEAGVKKLFHKVAIKPGKPLWVGLLPNGGLAFALPGNPFSCLVGFRLFVLPYLHACFGLPEPVRFFLPLPEGKKKKTRLDEFFPVRIGGDSAGILTVPLNGSGDIRLGLQANALGLHPGDRDELSAGEAVLCFPY